jgi:hypothetical protein
VSTASPSGTNAPESTAIEPNPVSSTPADSASTSAPAGVSVALAEGPGGDAADLAKRPLPTYPPPPLAPSVKEVVKMAESGVGEEILVAYIEQSTDAFPLTAPEVVYLNDLGIPSSVISTMIRHQAALSATAGEPGATPEAANAAAAELTATAALAPSAPPPPQTASAEATVQTVTNYVTSPAPPAPEAATTTAVVTPPAAVNYTYIYETLSPYGSWVEVAPYGWCWRPTVVCVDPYWRPYHTRGRWLYTDCGWYWNSDYSWGWLPFHYGRWYSSGPWGWVWVPGTTWGGAWVSWRYSSGYCGWAPLPPEARYVSGAGFYYRGGRVGIGFEFGLGADYYTFLPSHHFLHHSPGAYYVYGARGRPIYNRSTVVNNYIRGNNNNVVINVGMGTKPIESATRRGVAQTRVRELRPHELPQGRPERLERDGAALAVYRPNLPAPAGAPPRQVLQRQTEPRPLAAVAPVAGNTPASTGSASRNAAGRQGTSAGMANTTPRPVTMAPLISRSERLSARPSGNAPASVVLPENAATGNSPSVSRLQPQSGPAAGPAPSGANVRPSTGATAPQPVPGAPANAQPAPSRPTTTPLANRPASSAVVNTVTPPAGSTPQIGQTVQPGVVTPPPAQVPQPRAGSVPPTMNRQEPRQNAAPPAANIQPPKYGTTPNPSTRPNPSLAPLSVPAPGPATAAPRAPSVEPPRSTLQVNPSRSVTAPPAYQPPPTVNPGPTLVMPGGRVQSVPPVNSGPTVVTPRTAPPAYSPPQPSYQPRPAAPSYSPPPAAVVPRSAPPAYSPPPPASAPPQVSRQAPPAYSAPPPASAPQVNPQSGPAASGGGRNVPPRPNR